MPIRIGINGFGRIGRLVYRIAAQRGNFEIVGVNDLVPADNLAYLLHEPRPSGVAPSGETTPGAAPTLDADATQRIDELIGRLDRILGQDGHLI